MPFDITKPTFNPNPATASGMTEIQFDILDVKGRTTNVTFNVSERRRIFLLIDGIKLKTFTKIWNGINPVTQNLQIVDETDSLATVTVWVSAEIVNIGKTRSSQGQLIIT